MVLIWVLWTHLSSNVKDAYFCIWWIKQNAFFLDGKKRQRISEQLGRKLIMLHTEKFSIPVVPLSLSRGIDTVRKPRLNKPCRLLRLTVSCILNFIVILCKSYRKVLTLCKETVPPTKYTWTVLSYCLREPQRTRGRKCCCAYHTRAQFICAINKSRSW